MPVRSPSAAWANSMSEVLRDEQLKDCHSWAVPNVTPPRTPEAVKTERRSAEQGYRDGFERGRDEGRAAGEGEMQQVVARLMRLLTALQAPLAELDRQVEDELLALAMAVARQVIGHEPAAGPERVAAAIRGGLAALPAASRALTIHLHPEDHALVAETLQLDGDPPPRMVVDATITHGGCRIETADSIVDATVETRLATVIAGLLKGEAGG